MNKFTWRDGAWLLLGVLLGLAIFHIWFYFDMLGFIRALPVDTIVINLNETKMIEHGINYMNESGMLNK